jgi:hypothetical protein
MITYTHTLPDAAQKQGVDTIQVTRTIIEPSYIHAWITYGTTDADGNFQPDDLVGTHKLVIDDMESFGASNSTIDSAPSTKADTLEAAAAGLCEYADAHNLWHTTNG